MAQIVAHKTQPRPTLLRPLPGGARTIAGGTQEAEQAEAIGASDAFQSTLARVKRAANCPYPLLFRGETGTGKALLARLVHSFGPRARERCRVVRASTLTLDELQALLDQPGTLILREVSELPPELQGELLRRLEPGPELARVRVIATTSADLLDLGIADRFRRDLVFRLEVLAIDVPSLREREDDVLRLAEHFLEHTPGSTGQLTAEAELALQRYSWPGNVRELENALVRAATWSDGDAIGVDDLGLPRFLPIPLRPAGAPAPAETTPVPPAPTTDDPETGSGLAGRCLADLEREAILATIDACPTREEAARQLGVTSRTLRNKLNRYRAEGRI